MVISSRERALAAGRPTAQYNMMIQRTRNFFALAASFIIANVITTSALKGGYENVHTYNYEATVNVGVNGHVSEYNINGRLKIQRDVESDKYTLSLSDLKHNSYFGEENSMRIKHSNPIDNSILEIPFNVVYDESGMFKLIEHPRQQPEWAEKIKKSIAKLLQFNWQIVQQGLSNGGLLDEDENEEATVHGKCKVSYELKKKTKAPLELHEKILLTRIYALNSCNKFTDNVAGYLTNDEYTKKTIEDISKWDDSSIRNAYEIVINNDAPKLTMISNVENYQYSDNTDCVAVIKDNRQLVVKIRQYLTFLSMSSDEILINDFQKNDDEELTEMVSKDLVDKIINLVVEAYNYTEKDNLEMLIRGEEHRQLFNKIVSSLKRLRSTDYPILESIIADNPNSDKIRKILIPILPYVGTKHSIRYILRYIIPRKDYISDELAINLLIVFPTYAEKNIEPLELLESFLRYNSFGPSLLSEKIQEAAVLSLSHLLNRISVDKDLMVERFIPNIVAAFNGAKTTSSKIAFLSAIGNIREISALNKYTLPILFSILTQKKDTVIDQNRLRLAAINILSELVSYQVSDWDVSHLKIFDNLMVIFKDKSESRSIRLAAYDVIISKNNYDIKILSDITNMITDDKDLYNYHVSTVKGLQQSGLISMYPNSLGSDVSYSLSRSVILKADNIIKPELFKSTMKLQSGIKSYVKASLIYEDQSRTPNWQIPAMMKFEILEAEDEKLILNKAFYIYTNFNGFNTDKKVFFDFWTTFNQNSRTHYYDNIEFKNLPDLLDLSEIILKKIHEKLNFMYRELTTFSVATGFGIDAVFEHKYPSLISMLVDYNWKTEDDCLEAKIDFSLKESSNGYSGVSIYNPLSGLIHSIRKAQQLDSALSIGFIVKYNFTNQQLNFTLPIYSKEAEPKTSGLAVFTSTSVGVTNIDDEISCDNCGFHVTARHVPVSLKFQRFDYHGMLLSTMPYNCDIEQSFDYTNFLGNSDDNNEVNTCGFIAMMRPNTSKPFSQIELLLDVDHEYLKNMEEPWYFLPGYKFLFKLLIGNRQIITNNFNHLLKLDFDLQSSQGHFLNLLSFRFVKKTEQNTNFIVCYEAKVDFPEIGDDHLPTEITSSKLNAFSRVVMGHSQTELCSSIDFYVDFNVTGEVSEAQKFMLENSASFSQCSKQKNNPQYIYPRGTYPLTEDCIREMIANTTLIHYKLDVTSEMFSQFSLLQALLIIRSVQNKVKEIALNSHNANIDVKMTSPLSAIRSTKKMSFVADYSILNIYKNLPNIYFSQEFLSNFIDKSIIVVNVYPKIIVYNNEEKSFHSSNGWNEIYTGVDKTAYKIYANVLTDDKISLRILYRNYELIMKPKLVSVGTIDSSDSLYAPEIYYNQELFSDFDQRLHLFSTQDILFSLSRVDDYVVIRSNEIPIIIYYTTNSITVFQKI